MDNEFSTGMSIFLIIGFVAFVWGMAWVGFQIEGVIQENKKRKAKKNLDEEYIPKRAIGDSFGAFAGGIIGLLMAIFIRYG